MASMVIELYAALKTAGVPEDQATAAARVVAERDAVDQLGRDIAGIKSDLSDLKVRTASIDGQMQGMRWMLGFVMAGVTALIVRAFFGP